MSKVVIDRAVVEQALKALEYYEHRRLEWDYQDEQAINALRAALEQPQAVTDCHQMQPQVEQEPVAWIFQHDETGWITYVDAQKVKTGFEKGNPRWQKIYPVYLNPQPPRQPLTDEQILNFGPGQPDAVWTYEDQLYFARAIERAHGIGGEA